MTPATFAAPIRLAWAGETDYCIVDRPGPHRDAHLLLTNCMVTYGNVLDVDRGSVGCCDGTSRAADAVEQLT